jgi:hypothetical protein
MKPWTVMVYMAAHNELDSYAQEDLEEMKQVVVNDEINVVAQVDWPSSMDSQRLLIASGTIKVIGSAHNIPSYKPFWLNDFVSDCRINYPAERFALILWGHGSGIDWSERTRTYLMEFADDAAGNYMSVSDMALALNPPGGMRFDLAGFDACMMNMVEVYYEIGNSINVAVGSADAIPKPGWPYNRILKKVVAQPEMDAAELGAIVVDETTASYSEEPPSKVCFSSTRLAWRKDLVSPLKELTSQLLSGLDDKERANQIVQARGKTQGYKSNAYADLFEFCFHLKDTEFGAVSRVVCDLLEKHILSHKHSSQCPMSPHSRGLSICFPDTVQAVEGIDLPRVIHWGAYKKLRLCVETEWDVFVKKYLRLPT